MSAGATLLNFPIPLCVCGTKIVQARTGPRRTCCADCSYAKKLEHDRAKRDADPVAYRDASRGWQRKWRSTNPDKSKREYDRDTYRAQWARRVLGTIRGRSRRKGFAFDLTEEDIPVPAYCPVLGIKIEVGEGSMRDHSPSVDRIDPSKGYVKGNVQVISWRANNLKSNGTVAEFKRLITWLESVEAP